MDTYSILQEKARLGLLAQDVEQVILKCITSSGMVETVRFYKAVPWYIATTKCLGAYQSIEVLQSGLPQVQAEHSIGQGREPANRFRGTQEIRARRKRNREHEQAYIILHEEQTVTCEETGISYICRLPVPDSLNLATVHPLSFYSNVVSVMQAYSKTGIRIEQELEPQVLAGMLFTVLRHRNLLLCKDAPRANMFLQNAPKDTLAYAVRWFYNRPSTVGFPALALYLEDTQRQNEMLAHVKHLSEAQKRAQEAEQFILNYMKACRGESTRDEASHINIAAKAPKAGSKASVKVYSDTLVAQHKQAASADKTGQLLLAKLISAYPGQHTLLFSQIKTNLKILAFASSKLRASIASKLRETFTLNSDAIELAAIFATVQQDAIEDDLLSFTQTVTKERDAFVASKPAKVDFMSKLKAKG